MRMLDAGLDLLDRHIIDCDGTSVGKVDDVELDLPVDGGPPQVVALLLGPQAQGPRIGGRIGRWMGDLDAFRTGRRGPHRIPLELVDRLEVTVQLAVRLTELPWDSESERWLQQNSINRIPGGRRVWVSCCVSKP